MLICTYEDRAAALVGVKLLVLSLRRHCPDLPLVLCAPRANEAFRVWCARHATVTLDDHACGQSSGWNVKPSLLLAMLDRGHDEVVWLDSDIVLTADFRPLLYGADRDALVVSQAQYWDIYQRGSVRTELWGMRPGRSLPFVISSGFIRVTEAHRPLLERWRDLLQHPAYLRAQQQHLYRRPVHMLGDQDVLTALAASEEFADVPLVYLRRGRDIILSVGPAGFTLGERFSGMFRDIAPLIHCGGTKPWDLTPSGNDRESIKWRYERAYVETSPYVWAAKVYADELDEEMAGLRVETAFGRACRRLTFDDPVLQGLPQALVHTLLRRIKHALGFTAWPTPQANVETPAAPAARAAHSAVDVLAEPLEVGVRG